ncbi:MAG: elongation factor Ts [Acholeplasmatales bacterium]|nr:elongation factor Ts [Acholeplasmatales bacterium]
MAVTAQLVKELREKTGAGMLDCKKALEATDGNIENAITWLREKGIAKAAKKESRVAAEGLCNVAIDGNKAVIYEVNSETDFVSKNAQFLEVIDTIGKALLANDSDDYLNITYNGETISNILVSATATIGEKISLRRVTRVTKADNENFGAYKHAGGRIAVLTLVDGGTEATAKDVAMHVAAINPKYLSEACIPADELEKEKAIQIAEMKNDPKMANKPEKVLENIVNGKLAKYKKEICLLDQPFVKNPDLTVDQFAKSEKATIKNYIRLEVGEGIEKVETDFVAEVMAQVKA